MSANSYGARGMQAVAIFEAAKSSLLLVVGFGLFSLINHDVEATANYIVRHLHLNPAHHYPQIFLETARHVTDRNLWLFASLAMFDSLTRFVVAYGLWYDRDWAKWLGVATAGIYVPLEIYEMWVHFTVLKFLTFATNIAIIVYLGLELRRSKKVAAEPQAA